MRIQPIKTHVISPGEPILNIIDHYFPTILENSILAITSKIVSLCQNRIIPKNTVLDKNELVYQEADLFLDQKYSGKYGMQITIKNNILIPNAGIDESNGNDVYILYPQDVQAEAVKIWHHLRQRNGNKPVGVLITDSHTTPLRQGVIGIGLAWCGFNAQINYIGKPDLFNRSLKVTKVNVLDSLAVSAVFMMGEGNEATPFVLIDDIDRIAFQDYPTTEEEVNFINISIEDDLYAPLLQSVSWQKC